MILPPFASSFEVNLCIFVLHIYIYIFYTYTLFIHTHIHIYVYIHIYTYCTQHNFRINCSIPCPAQILAVCLNSFFVIYQSFASAALNVFECMKIDSGTVSGSTPAYYAKFQQVCTQYLHQTNTTVCKILQPCLDGPSQQAISPSGYWVLDMDQACYQGQHLTMWTPIGAVVSAIVCLGIPLLTALPIFINRSVQ